MPLKRTKATYMRGGTSRALIFRTEDLPASTAADGYAGWRDILLGAIGSPDPNGRQLNGIGGGISSLSKIAVVGPSTHPDADVDYTFGQVAIDRPAIAWQGNCGNISSAIGPFAVDEGLVTVSGDTARVRIHNTNTGKVIVSEFPLENGAAATSGDFAIEGVAGTGAPIRLRFMDPAGATTGALLPTGMAKQELAVTGFDRPLPVSLVDAANPVCFIAATSFGDEAQAIQSAPESLPRLKELRLAAGVAMGLAPDLDTARETLGSLPLIAILSPASDDDDADISVRMVSSDQFHKASPLTGAMCLAAAAAVEGTVVSEITGVVCGSDIAFRHPSGVLVVGADVEGSGEDLTINSVSAFRTARRIMDGWIYS